MVLVAIASLVATVAIPLMTKAVIDGPVRHQDQQGLWLLGAAATGVGVSEAVLWFIRRWLVSRATMGVEADIRKDLYARLQILPMSFHGRWQSGQLLSRIMNDLSTIRRFLSFGLIFLILNGLQISVVTAILLAMYWPLGVVVLLSVVPIAATVLHFQQEYIRLSRLAQDQSGHVATHVEEAALGLRVVKSFGREDYVYDRFDEQLTNLYDTQVEKVSVSAKFWTLLEVIPNLTLIVVLGFGAVRRRPRVRHDGNAGRVHHDDAVAGVADRFAGLLAVDDAGVDDRGEPDRRDLRRTRGNHRWPARPDAARRAAGTRRRRIQFPEADHWALRHVNVTVEPGETLALVGSTGSGKSVLAALLSRLYDVTEGEIRIDGRDIRELSLDALRQTVATAFEDPTLFSMSVAENLRLGRPDATDEQLAEAIDVAAAQFVYDLPFGLDTRIGEQGMSLSGGQRQRLSLARAILAAPKILVLDDTLSALDVHTEAIVEEALRRVLHSVTGIVVAHRASTVLLADRVALLEDGTITHVGTHADLLATVPEYRYLLAADDELDDTAERSCAWQDDERAQAARATPTRNEKPPMPPALSAASSPRRSSADDRHRHSACRATGRRVARPVRRGPRRRPASRREPAATSRSPRAAGLSAAAVPLGGRVPRRRGGRGERCAPVGSATGPARHRPRHPADRRRRIGAHTDADRRCAAAVSCWCRRSAGSSSCGAPGGSGRRCCSSCGAGCSATSSDSTSRSTTATPRVGWSAGPTNDVEAIQDMLETGFDSLITAVLTLVGTAILLVALDWRLGLMCLAAFPILVRWSGGSAPSRPRPTARCARAPHWSSCSSSRP